MYKKTTNNKNMSSGLQSLHWKEANSLAAELTLLILFQMVFTKKTFAWHSLNRLSPQFSALAVIFLHFLWFLIMVKNCEQNYKLWLQKLTLSNMKSLDRPYTERTFWANGGHFQTILPTEHQLESAKLRKFYILILCWPSDVSGLSPIPKMSQNNNLLNKLGYLVLVFEQIALGASLVFLQHLVLVLVLKWNNSARR